MSTPMFVDPESSTQADGAQSSRVLVPFPEDPYEAIRQESKGSGTFGTTSTSSDSTVPLSPDHPLTHATPALVLILRRTVRMAVRVLPAMSPGLSVGIAEVATMSDSAFRKSEEDEEVEESFDLDSESKGVEDEGYTAEDEDPAAGDEGLVAGVEGPGVDDKSYGLDDESHSVDDESRGLDDEGYSVESDGFGLGEKDVVPEGQGSGSAPELERSERVSASRQPTLTIWTDPVDDSPMATSATTISVDEDQFIEIALQRELREIRGRVSTLKQEKDYRERRANRKAINREWSQGMLERVVVIRLES
nr:hypothetical protein [Tanacetum cinerariifolium]